MKPPFSYFGGKQRIASRIEALLPSHRHYVEPFAGSLAVLLAKRPAEHETVNDLDGSLMTFWRVLRDQPEELFRACALTPHSRAEHRLACAEDGDTDLEKARRVWVLLTQGFVGSGGGRTTWRHYENPGGSVTSMPDYLTGYVARLPAVIQRMRQVSLECRPALEVVADYGQHPAVLLYVDPPYLGESRASSNGRYPLEMRSEADHRTLADALTKAAAAVVVSGYPSPLYDELYDGWYRTEIEATKSYGDERGAVEVLWSNRPLLEAPQGLF